MGSRTNGNICTSLDWASWRK